MLEKGIKIKVTKILQEHSSFDPISGNVYVLDYYDATNITLYLNGVFEDVDSQKTVELDNVPILSSWIEYEIVNEKDEKMKETKDEYIKRMTSGFEDDWGKSTYKYEIVNEKDEKMKETKDEYIKRMTSGFEDDWGKSTYKYEMVQKIPYTNPEKYLEQIEQVLKMETSNKMKIDVIKQTIQTYKGELKVFDF